MRIGIIAEGPSDAEVLASILKGWLGLDRADLSFLRPDLGLDETDLNAPSAQRFSNWEIVKQECVERTKIDGFLTAELDEDRYLIVQLDAAERGLPHYNVSVPPLPDDPALSDPTLHLAGAILAAILEWVGPPTPERLRAAVCIEEMDAWVLTRFVSSTTDLFPNPKERLERELQRSNEFSDKERKQLLRLPARQRYAELSKPFRKRKELNKAAEKSTSLRLFLKMLPDPPDP
jgi:hypothetical protein